MAYFGVDPILVADVVLWPARSIIKQSYEARERKDDSSLPFHLGYGNLNGDGFGIGWFPRASSLCVDANPCVFTSVTPAWNNENLNRLATKLESGLIFAHVRAAYPGMPVSEQNCHPFQWGRYLFMHNGVVAGFMRLRRALLARFSDAVYNTVQSFHSDSAVSFALFLNCLPDLTSVHPPKVLLRALEDAIATIREVQAEVGITATSLLNFVVSDGATMVATRYVSAPGEEPASLYYAEGGGFDRGGGSCDESAPPGSADLVQAPRPAPRACREDGRAAASRSTASARSVRGEADYHLRFGELGSRVVIIASEPVTASASDWVAVPRNTALVVCRDAAGVLCVLRSPLDPEARAQRGDDLLRCLDAVARPGTKRWEDLAAGGGDVADREVGAGGESGRDALGSEVDETGKEATAGNSATVEEIETRTSSPRGRRSSNQLPAFGEQHMKHPPSTPAVPSTNIDLPSASGQPPLPLPPPKHASPLHSPRACRAVPASAAHRLTGHRGAVTALCAHHSVVYSGGADASVRAWNAHDLSPLAVLAGHRDPIRALRVHGRWLLSLGAKTLRLWRLSDHHCEAVLRVADAAGSALAASAAPDGWVYVGGQGCAVAGYCLARVAREWSGGIFEAGSFGCQADEPMALLQADPSRSRILPPFLNGSPLSAASPAPSPRPAPAIAPVPDALTPPEHSHCGAVCGLAADERHVYSAGADATLRVWALSSLRPRAVLRGHAGAVLCVQAAAGVVLSGGRDASVRVWDAHTLVCRRVLTGHGADVMGIAGLSLPAPGMHAYNELLSPRMAPLSSREAGEGWVEMAKRSISPGEAKQGFNEGFLSSAQPPMPLPPASLPSALSLPAASPLHAAATPLQPLLFATASADGSVRVWDARSWACVSALACGESWGERRAVTARGARLGRLGHPALACALSENHVAAGAPDGQVRLFSVEDVLLEAVTAAAQGDEGGGSDAPALKEADGGHAWTWTRDRRALAAPQQPLEKRPFASEEGTDVLPASLEPVAKRACLEAGGGAVGTGPAAVVAPPPSSSLALAAASRLERELESALRRFVSLRTVSGDASLREECFRGAKFVLRLLEGLGAEATLVRPRDDRNPLVVARLGDDPRRPTVVFYGHYDVLPARLGEWGCDPWCLSSVDGYLYGRGVSANKGPLLAFVYAVKELLAEEQARRGVELLRLEEEAGAEAEKGANGAAGGAIDGGPLGAAGRRIAREPSRCLESGSLKHSGNTVLPVNVAWIVEGEEQGGSRGFVEALAGHSAWFSGASVVLLSHALWVGERLPCLTYGMRGMLGLRVEVTGPARDLHSGNHGGVFGEPLAELTALLASLQDARGRVLVPGFCEGVRRDLLDPALERAALGEEIDLRSFREGLGVPELRHAASEAELLTALWCRPSLSVVDVSTAPGGGISGWGAEQRAHAHGLGLEDGGKSRGACNSGQPRRGAAAARSRSSASGSPRAQLPPCAASSRAFGPTRYSVIPRSARAQLVVRFVPDQDADALVAAIRSHLEAQFAALGSANSLRVRVEARGDWWEAERDSRWMRAAEEALREEWGVAPLLVREGGTMPVVRAMERELGAPSLVLPMGQASDNANLVDERIRRENLLRGKNVVKRLLRDIGTWKRDA